MCGIAGIIDFAGVNLQQIVQMTNIISHRGPDDEGFVMWKEYQDKPSILGGKDTPANIFEKSEFPYLPVTTAESVVDASATILLGHRRLSILDLSPAGHQPMSYLNNRYWIVFNGEVYNYIELRDELILKGHSFLSHSDTEVVLAAYHEWGMDCQHKFNGMWAFTIFDTKENIIFMSRDRYGIKPLYYWFSPQNGFYFASEIKQFTICPGWRAILNAARAYDYLYYALTDHTDETLFKGVNMLLPGHCYHGKAEELFNGKNKGKLDLIYWYKPNIKQFWGSFEEAKENFLAKFKDAVKLHLRADVPVGSALSGGLDSSSIVSYINVLLREQGKTKLQKTFSSCSEDERFDERKWMDIVAKETKVEGHYVYPKGEEVFSLTEKLIWHMDEPYQSQSAFLGYHVFQEAKKNDVLVLLNGQGADEYLSGYTDFRILRKKRLLKKGKIGILYKELRSVASLSKLLFVVLYDGLPSKFKFILANNTKKQRHLDNIIDLPAIKKKKIHPYKLNPYVKNTHTAISSYQLFKEPLQKYLRWEDRNSMAHSVEARVPFLDYRLVEFANSLPLDYLDSGDISKRILVESMKGILPEEVRQRKDKKGFVTPEQKWFMTDHKEKYLEMLRSNVGYSKGVINADKAEKFFKDVQKGDIPFDYTYWHLLLFSIWMKVFKVEVE